MRLVRVYLVGACGVLLILKAMVMNIEELGVAGTLMLYLAAMLLVDEEKESGRGGPQS